MRCHCVNTCARITLSHSLGHTLKAHTHAHNGPLVAFALVSHGDVQMAGMLCMHMNTQVTHAHVHMHAHTHTCTHTNTHTHTHALTIKHTHLLILTVIHTHSQSHTILLTSDLTRHGQIQVDGMPAVSTSTTTCIPTHTLLTLDFTQY